MRMAAGCSALFVLICIASSLAVEDVDTVLSLGDETEDLGEEDQTAHSLAMDEEAAFDKFAQHKNYHSKEEYAKRFAVYKENVAFVRKWNAEGHSFQVLLRPFRVQLF